MTKVNYIGRFLSTKFFLSTLHQTAQSTLPGTVRIISVSSDGHAKLAPNQGIILSYMNLTEGYSVWTRYGYSKLANVLHAKALAKRYPEILSPPLHPGTVTNLSQAHFHRRRCIVL
ncbi:hypothetical protein BDV12DRAFT_202528 [Aspergillus spectabilis]